MRHAHYAYVFSHDRWLADCAVSDFGFDPLPEDLQQQIEQIKDLARLERLIRQSPRLDSLDELQL